MDERPVYILLSRSTTVFACLIRAVSKAQFSHASVSISGPCGPFYSFGRLYPRLPFPGGFIKEGPDMGFFAMHPNTPCRLYELQVDRPEYNRLRHYLKKMEERKGMLRYNLLGVIFVFFQKPLQRDDCYFCSEFVASSLYSSGIIEPVKPAALMHPEDFQKIRGVQLVYEGRVDGLKRCQECWSEQAAETIC